MGPRSSLGSHAGVNHRALGPRPPRPAEAARYLGQRRRRPTAIGRLGFSRQVRGCGATTTSWGFELRLEQGSMAGAWFADFRSPSSSGRSPPAFEGAPPRPPPAFRACRGSHRITPDLGPAISHPRPVRASGPDQPPCPRTPGLWVPGFTTWVREELDSVHAARARNLELPRAVYVLWRPPLTTKTAATKIAATKPNAIQSQIEVGEQFPHAM